MEHLEEIRRGFLESLSRIAEFWGYPRAMGALYAALYLSPIPLSLDELIPIVGVTKGSISVNVRALEQLRMVRKQVRQGDRKDYYDAETNFWKIAKAILERRQKPEFDMALNDVSQALAHVRSHRYGGADAETARFYKERLESMESFFHTLDGIVGMLLQMECLRVEGLRALLGTRARRDRRGERP